MMRQESQYQQDYYSKVLYDLAIIVLNIMKSPTQTAEFSDVDYSDRRRQGPPFDEMTPAGFASLLVGISVAMMLGGSITFFLGFLLMPWVIGLVVFLYFVGIISSFSMIWKSIMFQTSSSPPRQNIVCENL